MSEWKEYKLSDIVLSANTGLDAIKRAPIVEEETGIKCLRIQDISQKKPFIKWGNSKVTSKDFERAQLLKDDIIMARTCSPGIVFKAKENLQAVFNNGLAKIRPNRNLTTADYLFYLFKSSDFIGHIYGISDGTSVQLNMKLGDLLSYKLNLPPLPEQTAIASVLSSLDDKIDLLHRQNATLEKMAETLFRQWFVEEADESWETMPLSKMANFLNGLACQKFPPKNEIDKLPVLKIKELSSGITENSDWASTEIKPEYIVINGDIVFAWSASLMVKIWNGQDCILNQHLFKVTSEDYPKWFYYLWCKHHLAEFISIAASHATTMGHIKRGDLDEAKVLIPGPEELAVMTAQAEPLIDKIIANNIQLNTLTKLRDSLLPKLMSGEVTIEP